MSQPNILFLMTDQQRWDALSIAAKGIAGAWVGRLLLGLLGVQGPIIGLVAAVVGAMLLLLLYRQVKK